MLRFILILVVCFAARHTVAQQPLSTSGNNASGNKVSVSDNSNSKLYYGNRNDPPRAIEFRQQTVTASRFLTNINQYLNVPAEFTFVEMESNTDELGMKHRLLQQYYKGLLLDGLNYRVHEKQGFVTSANGRATREVKLEVQTVISEEQAYHLAVRSVNGKDSLFRKGKKLIASRDFAFTPESFAVAFQFDIDISLIEQWRISIDARTGEVINKVSLVMNCGVVKENLSPESGNSSAASPVASNHEPTAWLPYGIGLGTTNFYGRKPIRVEMTGTTSSTLTGETEHGGLIRTADFQNAPVIMLSLLWEHHRANPFSSSDNTYHASYVQPAVSAQWAAEQAFEYYYKRHGRNSYDNNGSTIVSYVHVDKNMNNAFWTHNLLALGDGSNNNPLVEIDVISHELTHGVTQFEAGLDYYKESGALNESFSDIMGKAVEFDLFGDTATWQMGRHFEGGGIRNLSDPNRKNQPDTYFGDFWSTGAEDQGGVHTNSGVQNFWFYLLCKGGSGVNDHQESYSINAIGIEAASKIAYRNLTEYLGRQSQYLDARIGSLLAAADLYGYNSANYRQVDKAWDAVGVTDEPIITRLETYDITATTVKLRGALEPRGNAVTYHFEYGTTPAMGSSTVEQPYTNTVIGQLTGLQSEARYYLDLVATNENGSTTFHTEFTTISLAPLVRIKETVDVTETTATLYGQINPNSLATNYYFEYGTTPSLGLVTPTFSLTNATEFQDVSATISNLEPRKTYYYRLKATNSHSSAVTGSARFFTAVRPVIVSFSPLTAPIGATVTIAGSNFNAVAAKNVVHFGATRGIVLSATTNQIKVKVPAGASLAPISLLDAESGLATESIREFVTTFTGFNNDDMHLTVGINDPYVYETAVQDMDGDSKPDIVASHYLGFSVYLNVNQGGDITEQSFVRNTFNSESSPNSISLADIDGNGMKDVLIWYREGLRIYPNLSVPGYVFFGVPIDVPDTKSLDNILFGDFDQDGHIDILGTEYQGGVNQVIVIRNQNPLGVISAANFSRYAKPFPYYIWFLNSSDVNNDGKPDVMAGPTGDIFLAMLKNNSSPGTFDFEEIRKPDNSRTRFARYIGSDLNGDGWKDLVRHSPYEIGSTVVFENAKTTNTIGLKDPAIVLANYNASVVKPGDFNGDGKIDLVVGTDKRELLFLANKGNAGGSLSTVSFEKVATRGMKLGDSRNVDTKLTVSDLNGDGRPEVISTYSYSYSPRDGYVMEIWQNSPANCLDPEAVQVEVSGKKATIALPAGTTLDNYEIDYTLANYQNWTPVTEPTLQLSSGYKYRLRVRAKCYLEFTEYAYIDFATDCVDLSGFGVTTGVDNAKFTLYYVYNIEIEYSNKGENDWKAVSQNTTQISNLTPGTTYDIRYRGRCVTPGAFTYDQFTTQCPILNSINISEIDYDHAKVIGVSSYKTDTYFEYRVDDANWTPVDDSGMMSALTPATKYYVRGRLQCNDLNSEFFYTTFMTKCPKVLDLEMDAVTPFSAIVKWTDNYQTGQYQLSYRLRDGGPTTSVSVKTTSYKLVGLSPGGAYVVTVAPACTNGVNEVSISFSSLCYVPTDLSADDITYTSAKLSWNSAYNGVPYTLKYSIAESGVWKSVKLTETNYELSNLRPGTEYDMRVQIECLSEQAGYTSLRFRTELYDETTYGPNPTPDKITLHPSKNLIGNHFVLSDNAGRIMLSGDLLDYTIDLSSFSRGVYTLRIDGEAPIRIVKL